jgi:predicted translin family RNA/ssDNA-binding protein
MPRQMPGGWRVSGHLAPLFALHRQAKEREKQRLAEAERQLKEVEGSLAEFDARRDALSKKQQHKQGELSKLDQEQRKSIFA